MRLISLFQKLANFHREISLGALLRLNQMPHISESMLAESNLCGAFLLTRVEPFSKAKLMAKFLKLKVAEYELHQAELKNMNGGLK